MKKCTHREWRTGDLRFIASHLDSMTLEEIAHTMGVSYKQTRKFAMRYKGIIEQLRLEYRIQNNQKSNK